MDRDRRLSTVQREFLYEMAEGLKLDPASFVVHAVKDENHLVTEFRHPPMDAFFRFGCETPIPAKDG